MKQTFKLIVAIIMVSAFYVIEINADSTVNKELKVLKKEYTQLEKEYNKLIEQGAPSAVIQRKGEELGKLSEVIGKFENGGNTNQTHISNTDISIEDIVLTQNIDAVTDPGTDASSQNNSQPKKSNTNEEISLTVSSDGATKDDALKNALRTAIEQAYGAFVSANTTILNDELVKDEIVTVSNGSIKDYKEISSFEKPDGSGYMITVNATVSLPHLITYAKNHGSECEFAGNTFGMELKLFNLQKENELKALYNAIPAICDVAKNSMKWELNVSEPVIVDWIVQTNSYKTTEHAYPSKKLLESYDVCEVEVTGDYNKYYLGEISGFANKPIKRKADGRPTYTKDLELWPVIQAIIEEPRHAIISFNIQWEPVDNIRRDVHRSDENELDNVLYMLMKSLTIDKKTFEKFEAMGVKPTRLNVDGLRYSDIFNDENDRSYHTKGELYLRNTPNDIRQWVDSLYISVSDVSNNFMIIDNNNEESYFGYGDMSRWISNRHNNIEDYTCYYPSTVSKDSSTNYMKRWDTSITSDYKCLRIPGILKRFRRNSMENQHYFFCAGGKGIFSGFFFVNVEEIPEVEKYSIRIRKLSEINEGINIAASMPLSQINKYSSFKVMPKEQ